MIFFQQATTVEEYNLAKSLFLEYASELNIDLSFQDFNDEINNLKVQYSPPGGILLIGYTHNHYPVGCFGIRRLDAFYCELKRMYLKNEFRGRGIGDQMILLAIDQSTRLNYHYIRLDTLPSMTAAISLYGKYGFYEIPPYRFNPIEGSIYLEKKLI